MISQIYLLPGMDGTGSLLGHFCAAILDREQADGLHYDATILSIPTDLPNTYDRLVEHFGNKLFRDFASEKYVLVAESFSGPLAVRLAASHPDRIASLVLVSTFLRCPIPSFARLAPWSLLFRMPLPEFVIRRFLTGANASLRLSRLLRESVSSVHPTTMAQRLRAVIATDVRKEFSQITIPLLFVEAEYDRIVTWQVRRQAEQLNAHAQFATIAGPHLLLQTQPLETWHLIREFLAAVH